ncbi:MAG: VCBS repeat-containing protein [Acidobacteria bacterium]|nr:VCBS repeat-containing protein [Acidobacteriota bacterium]MBI3425191.1 VCBS repeat-containing protein [Acidobacteriota bacterium]
MRSSRRAICRIGIASCVVLLFALCAHALSGSRAFQNPPVPPRPAHPAQVLPSRTCFTTAFAAPLSLATGCCLTQVAVGDFNGDGHADLLPNDLDTASGSSTRLRAGDGRGNFGFDLSNGALGGPGSQSFIATGDFNGDGKPDLVMPRGLGNEPLLLQLSAANGRFTTTTGAFGTYTNRNASAAISADFNGDGKNDLAVADGTARELTLLSGDGTGRFPASLGAPFKLNTNAVLLAAADFNQDGKADLALADQVANELTILLSQAAGTLAANPPIKLASRPTALVTGDFDRDGRTDLAVANQDITLLFNQPNGSFVSQTVTTNGAAGLTAANFDNDEWLDLAVSFAGRLTLLRGGPAGFTASSFMAAPTSGFITNGDFNEDGRQDLAVVTAADNASGRVLILLNNGAGGFNLPPGFAAGNAPRLLAQADFNRDGIPDVVTASQTDEVNLLLGSRNGFAAPRTFKLPPVGTQSFTTAALLTADFNRDGNADCAVAGAQGIYLLTSGADGALRLLNDTPLPFPTRALQSADFNADGWPDLAVHDGVSLRVLFNETRPDRLAFTPAPSVNVGRPIGLGFLAGQFDADAQGDVIFFDTTGFIGYRVAQGDGTGGFTIRQGVSISDGAGVAGAVGDFNGDGRLDLATADLDASNNDVQVHLGYNYQRGPGGTVLYGGTAFAVGNLNNDGKDDLVQLGNDALAVILNPAVERFVLPINQAAGRGYNGYAIGGTPGRAVVGDFDGDGRGDIAVINQTTNRLVLLHNLTQANQAPTLHASTQSLNLAQGDANARLKLADVADVDAAPGALNAVALNLPAGFAATLSVEGGALYGSFTVPCEAALGARAFEVLLTDQCLAKAQTTLTLNLQPNSPPQLGAYPETIITSGAAFTVKPSAPPADNGSFTLVVGAAGFNGALSINTTTGEVRIANAVSSGVYTVLVTATDRCGATATQRFTLTVNLPGACGAPAFSAETFTLTHHPTLLATADFDRDGNLDLAATNLPAEPSAEITLLHNTGAGRLEKWKTLRPARFAAGLLAADFNQDGKADLAYSYSEADSGVLEVLLGDGTGAFAPPRRTAVAQAFFTTLSADLNGDGRLDLAALVDGKQQLAVLFGDGNGGFAMARNIALPTDGARLVSGDFNRDGWPDLAVTTFRASLLVLRGTGNGEFAAPRTQSLPFSDFSTSYILAADFNNDGKADLAVTGIEAATRNNVTLILLGDGAGGFTLRSTNAGAGPLAAADFDRDGRADLLILTGMTGAEGVLLLLGAGDGTFCAAKGINPATANTDRRVGVALGDFDQDGKPDLVLAADFFWQLTTLLNRTL